MTRHADTYTLIRSLDLSGQGITSWDSQLFRSATADSPEVRPFIILKWGTTTPWLKTIASEELQVWMYDESSYVPIEQGLKTIRDALLAAPDVMGDLTWNGYSDDLYDDVFECVTRYVSFTLPAGAN